VAIDRPEVRCDDLAEFAPLHEHEFAWAEAAGPRGESTFVDDGGQPPVAHVDGEVFAVQVHRQVGGERGLATREEDEGVGLEAPEAYETDAVPDRRRSEAHEQEHDRDHGGERTEARVGDGAAQQQNERDCDPRTGRDRPDEHGECRPGES